MPDDLRPRKRRRSPYVCDAAPQAIVDSSIASPCSDFFCSPEKDIPNGCCDSDMRRERGVQNKKASGGRRPSVHTSKSSAKLAKHKILRLNLEEVGLWDVGYRCLKEKESPIAQYASS